MNLLKNQKGSTIIILTFLILTAVLSVVLTASKIVQTGLVLDRTQFESTKAYFAAEAGAERILWAIRSKNPTYDVHTQCCPTDSCPAVECTTNCYIPFDGTTAASSNIDEAINMCDTTGDNNNETQVLSNDAEYYIEYYFDTPTTTLRVTGSFDIVDRRLQLKY